MSRRAQQIVIAVVALALIVPLGAVGLAQVFGNASSSPSSASASPSDTRPVVDPASQPTAAPTQKPEQPAAISQQTSEGAQAALQYFLGSYAYMMASGDTGPWTTMADPNCQVCLQFIANAKQLHSQGGWGVGGEFTITSTAFEGTGDPPASGTATAAFQQAAQQIIDDPRRAPEQEPALSGQIQAKMVWDGAHWRIGDMSVADAQGSSASDAGGASG